MRATIIQARETSEEDIQFVQRLIKENPGLHRKDLSIELSTIWNWRDATGRLKDMACRSYMLTLHKQGRIILPPPLRAPTKRKKNFSRVTHSKAPIVSSLKELLPLQVKNHAQRTWL